MIAASTRCRQLHELGYTNVRDYRAGIADWVESGEPTESVAQAAPEPNPSAAMLAGPPLAVGPDGHVGRVPARLSPNASMGQLGTGAGPTTLRLTAIPYLDRNRPTVRRRVLACSASRQARAGRGRLTGCYFSFITATTIGYGDIVPVGIARWIAVAEAVTALLIFGAVVAKFVSHRQEELTSEIQRVTFEERLDRVQTNLHMVISELLSITAMCEAQAPLNGIGTRLDSSALIFLGEMRSIHDLLYQPRLVVEEGVLGR